jgi:hypothetical protein
MTAIALPTERLGAPRLINPLQGASNMIRAKMLTVLVGMIATLAVSAAPAFAEFESTTGKATGAGKSGPVVLEGGGATLECSSAEGTGTVLSKQGAEALKGPILALNTTTWIGCKAKSKEIKEVTPKVKACNLHLVQAAGVSQAKGSVASECTVETKVLFFTCVIHVTAEKVAPVVNFNLETNNLENVGANLVIKAADSGVTTTTTGVCPGITGSKEGKQKATVTGEGVKWV